MTIAKTSGNQGQNGHSPMHRQGILLDLRDWAVDTWPTTSTESLMSLAKSIFFCSALLTFVANASATTMSWSYVGNPENAADPLTGFGAVPYAYNIGTYDVTAGQYAEFLNAKDPSGANTLQLWNHSMAGSLFGGISFNGDNPSGSRYVVTAGRQNHPAECVTWYDAIRFANWMNNGQGTGDTETGAYTLGPSDAIGVPINGNSITRNVGAKVFLPSENEWYKAAYNIPGSSSYKLYPTSSNAAPIASGPTALANHANYHGAVESPTDVGAYTGTTSPYGAFDMAGNVWQWNELLLFGSLRGVRGSSFFGNSGDLLSSFRPVDSPSFKGDDYGFRLASVPGVPEPSTLDLAAFGFIGLIAWRWRQKRA